MTTQTICSKDDEDFSNWGLAIGDDADPDAFPRMSNMSAAFFFQALPIPATVEPPEFAYVPMGGIHEKRNMERYGFIAQWGLSWACAQLRPEMWLDSDSTDRGDVPEDLRWLDKYNGRNIHLLPKYKGDPFTHHAALYHLLPREALERAGLPLLAGGQWPHEVSSHLAMPHLPPDTAIRLRRALAQHIWRRLEPQSRFTAFSGDDPLKLLAHNLDFWMGPLFRVCEERLRSLGPVPADTEDPKAQELLHKIEKANADMPDGVRIQLPYYGADLWRGETEAEEATDAMIEMADQSGRLRSLIDTIRANRLEDDFSDEWSYAKEDMEKRLHHKRARVKVTFCEVDGDSPIIGPDSEVHADLVWGNLMGLVSRKDRHVIVLLRRGVTQIGEIAERLGYANHSPVSKALARIRVAAKQLLDV